MKYFLWGDDTLTLHQRKQELVKEFLEHHPQGQVLIFSVEDNPEELERIEQEMSPALFETPKFLVVENIAPSYSLAKERIENLFKKSSSADIVFLEYQKFAQSDPFFKLVKKSVEKEENYEAKKRDLKKIIHSLEDDLGGKLDKRTLLLIQERSGKDDELILQNIQKVLTYARGNSLSVEELDALVPASAEAKVFDALDALANGEKEKAYSLFHLLLTQEDIFRILPLCAWQIRQMLLVAEAKERHGERKDEIAKAAGMHPFVVQKLLRVLPNFSRARLAKGLRLLARVDIDLKQGRKTPEGALEYFVFQW